MTLHVLTYHTPSPYPSGHQRQCLSCARYGVELTCLSIPLWRGHMEKLLAVWRWLMESRATVADDDLLLYVDAFDTVFVRALDGFEDAFNAFGAGVVFSAERTCHPFEALQDRFPKVSGPYRYLNAGVFAGRVGAVKNLLATIRVMEWPATLNDQGVLAAAYVADPSLFALDSEAKLFQNLYAATEDVAITPGSVEITPGSVTNTLTGARPFVCHASGHAPWGCVETFLSGQA